MVDRFAACLADFGIKKGDAVAILLPNIIPCVVAYYAILKIGAITVMNNPLYSDPELEHQFNDSGAKVLITLDVLGKPDDRSAAPDEDQADRLLPASATICPPSSAFWGNGSRSTPSAKSRRPRISTNGKSAWKNTAPNPPAVKCGFEDVAMYQYTGGTTGVSKGVMLTHANLSKQAQQLAAWFPKLGKGGQIMLGALPYFHVFGLSCVMNYSIYKGWAQVLVPRPQPEPLLEAIRNFCPTFAPLVPTMYIGMLNHPDLKKTKMSCIKGAFSGSAPLPVEVIHEFEKATGAVIVEGFGMTETTPVTHINPFAGGARKVGSIGLPISDTLARIVDLEDEVTDVPVGRAGRADRQGAPGDAAATRTGRTRRPKRSATAGAIRATSPRWTRRATSTSSTGRRT